MIKNIKLYCSKEKFKKLKLIVLPIALSITMVVSGYSVKKNEKDTNFNNTIESVKTDEIQEINGIEVETKDEVSTSINFNEIGYSDLPSNYSLLDQKVFLDSNQLSELKLMINKPTYYQNSEYFETEKALSEYKNFQNQSVISNNIISNGKIEHQKLYETVLKNNESFIKEGVNNNIFESFSNNEISLICGIITNTLNNLIETCDIDQSTLDYNLSNLKIFKFSKYLYATITTEGCLAINESFIDTMNIENALEKIIVHESIHLAQKRMTSNNTGVNYKFSDLKVNSLFNEWFIETSAEKVAARYNEGEISYNSEMKYLDAMIIATSFEEENIENINFSNNLNSFYEILNCDGLISNEEIANMMYAINFTINENKEFLDHYEECTGSYLSYSETKTLKNNYSSSFFETLSKKMYYDLSRQNLSLRKILSIISLFENSCSDAIWYSDPYKLEGNKNFIENYNMLQKTYFSLLATNLNVSVDEIFSMYNYYNENESISIDFTNKNEQLNDILLKIEHNKGFGINKIYEQVFVSKTK